MFSFLNIEPHLIAYQANSLLYLETKLIKVVLLHAHYYISVLLCHVEAFDFVGWYSNL
jgi:hypothetical protein